MIAPTVRRRGSGDEKIYERRSSQLERRRNKMGVYKPSYRSKDGTLKRSKVYWYGFWFSGVRVQQSAKTTNPRVARQMEAAHRTALARGEAGFREKKSVPTLAVFIRDRFEPWAKVNFEINSPKTWLDWYRTNLRTLVAYAPLAEMKLDQITGEIIADFAAYRQGKGLQVSSVNSSLRVLRRVLRIAAEWGTIAAAPKITLLRGERHRERVLTPSEEALYLATVQEPLASIAAVLIDSGMRRGECFGLRWEDITWVNGRHGFLFIRQGKTPAARRPIPMTSRARRTLEILWQSQGGPSEGWVWPAPTQSGHIENSGIRDQHSKAFEALEKNLTAVRPFVLHELRHTFLTRLGMSGMDLWNFMRIAGHSSPAVSARYVHAQESTILVAMERLESLPTVEPKNRLPMLPA
jgi:integrase